MRRAVPYLALLAATLVPCGRTAEVTSEGRPEAVVTHVELLFAGDVMCHMPQVHAAATSEGFDFSATFECVRPLFGRADVSIVNLETVISPDAIYRGYPAFSSPPELASSLRDAGVDIAVTANNHCCDRGARGIRSTIACLDSLGIAHTGTWDTTEVDAGSRLLRFESRGIRFALMNYTYGTNGIPVPDGCTVNLIDTAAMARDAKEAADADLRIAFLHWGEEYERRTNAAQLKLKEFLQRHGVEIIIGSHPHVIQPAEVADNRIFVSSLGNFVSNQRKRYSDGGLIAEVGIDRLSTGELRTALKLVPVWVKLPDYRILPPEAADTVSMSAAEQAHYKQFMADTEELLSKSEILQQH